MEPHYMPPHGIINDEDREEELPDDYSPPFSAPDGVVDTVDDTHPEADMLPDSQQQYDEGIDGSIETKDPGNRGVLGYTPPASDDEDDKEE